MGEASLLLPYNRQERPHRTREVFVVQEIIREVFGTRIKRGFFVQESGEDFCTRGFFAKETSLQERQEQPFVQLMLALFCSNKVQRQETSMYKRERGFTRVKRGFISEAGCYQMYRCNLPGNLHLMTERGKVERGHNNNNNNNNKPVLPQIPSGSGRCTNK